MSCVSAASLDASGAARMVDVSGKDVTARTAVACGTVRTTSEVIGLLTEGGLPKGDALTTARLAGVMGAKRTSELIPLCHQIALTKVDVDFELGTDSVDITATIHGPVIAGDPARGAALTLKSVQFAETDRSLDCLIPMLRAGSCDELFLAVRGWGLIDHNLVAADTGGHIGHLVRAVVPRRPAVNGWLPVPGWTGEYEWDGMIPADRMPRADDPERGFLVTANNRVVTTVPGTGDYFCTDAHPPARARRIEDLLAGPGPVDPSDMTAIHADDASESARLFQSALAEVTPPSASGTGWPRPTPTGPSAPRTGSSACSTRPADSTNGRSACASGPATASPRPGPT